ncbi:MAG: trehalase family glycosidase [Chloroflexi bacterium]|nr:trehalase family glycosidase [Chloroflexota bacterium]
MRDWSLTAKDPLVLALAADVRFCAPDYADDQIWELRLAGGDPPALSLITSFGRRARSMRLFPFFSLDGRRVSDPERFASAPLVRRFLPNYACVDCRPFDAIAVAMEAWVPESHALAGRIAVTNLTAGSVTIRCGVHVQLAPHENGQPASPTNVRGVTVLAGRAGNLNPVLFLAGGAVLEGTPIPALAVNVTLAPGATRLVPWVHAGRPSVDESFDLARAVAGRSWDAELARLEVADASTLEFETGRQDWDAVLTFSQQAALRSFLGASRYLRHPSFVAARQPDLGYSERGDGRDHPIEWSGQDPARSAYVMGLVAPAAPELALGVIHNYLNVQAPDGLIDWRPGLAGQRQGSLCIPWLADWVQAWCVRTQDWSLARESLPRLLAFYRSWFSPAHDRDQDGHPEWDHAAQALSEDSPTFGGWQPWSQGLDIRAAETVDLACALYRETVALLAMAAALGREELRPELEQRARQLRQAVENSWSEATGCYHAVDRDTHCSPVGGRLATLRGPQRRAVAQSFDPAARLVVICRSNEANARGLHVVVRGKAEGRPATERLTFAEFRWFFEHGIATSDRTFSRVESIEAGGISSEVEIEVSAADFSRGEVTHLLPLWAGIPDAPRAQDLVRRTLLDPARYWRAHGLPVVPADDPAYRPDRVDGCGGTWMPWNAMIIDGLVAYGYRAQAADLFTRLMGTIVASARSERCFHEAYNADALQGLGGRHDLAGAAPVHSLLRILGIELAAPTRLRVEGRSPFDRPITVRWRGLEVRRDADRTRVTFPDGEQVELDGEEQRWIEQTE